MEQLKDLLGKMKKRFGNTVDSLDRIADFLVDEGFSYTDIVPRFADMPSGEYKNGNLCLSFSKTRSVNEPENGQFLVMNVRSEKAPYVANLPLDDLNKYL